MNFDLPAGIEREVQRFASAEHLTLNEAAITLIRKDLRATKTDADEKIFTDEELRKADPAFEFFDGLPESVLDRIEEASREIRAERFVPRV